MIHTIRTDTHTCAHAHTFLSKPSPSLLGKWQEELWKQRALRRPKTVWVKDNELEGLRAPIPWGGVPVSPPSGQEAWWSHIKGWNPEQAPCTLHSQVYITGLCAHMKEVRSSRHALEAQSWAFLGAVQRAARRGREASWPALLIQRENGNRSNNKANPFTCLHHKMWLYLQYTWGIKKRWVVLIVFCLLGLGWLQGTKE